MAGVASCDPHSNLSSSSSTACNESHEKKNVTIYSGKWGLQVVQEETIKILKG